MVDAVLLFLKVYHTGADVLLVKFIINLYLKQIVQRIKYLPIFVTLLHIDIEMLNTGFS